MRRYLTAALFAAVAGSVLGLAAVPGSAGAKPAPPTPPAHTANPDEACTLSPSLTHPAGETGSCLAVGTKLSSLPTRGHTATLTVTVQAARAEKRTRVTVDLPRTFAFADGTATHPAHTGAGPVARTAPVVLSLAAGQSRSFTRTVKAIATGFGEIAAVARNRVSAGRTDGGTDSTFLTVMGPGEHSRLGASDRVSSPAQPTARGTTAAIRPELATRGPLRAPPSRPRPARQATVRPDTAGTSCATGVWQYGDQNGVYHPGHNVVVAVLSPANHTLAAGYSLGDGSFDLCFKTGGKTTTVHLTFTLANPEWAVQNFSNSDYSYFTVAVAIADGTTTDFGALSAGGDPSNQRAPHAYQLADDEYQWVYQYFPHDAGCWSPYENPCRQLVIHWANDNTTLGTDWNRTRGVYLMAGSPDSVSEPLHEYGHNLMYELYGNTFPADDCASPHYLFAASGTNCGWTEGWADWVSTSVLDSSVYTFDGGITTDFNLTWNQCGNGGCDTGPTVEARVVQAMRSLSDGVKAPFDNDPGEGNGNRDNRIWFDVLHTDRPNNFGEVWSDRGALGYDTSQTALSALYQGTIDYGFRNPLSDYVGKHLPEAVPNHNYSYTTTLDYWSVVAIKPDSGTDVDLRLYSDAAQHSLLSISSSSGTATDFVGINSNSGHRATGQTYYPTVSEYSGTGGYAIDEAQGPHVLSTGSSTNYLYGTQPVRVWDSNQTAGTPIHYRAVPSSGQAVQLASLGAGSDVVSRSASVLGTDPGAGKAATLVVNPGASGYAGLVLLNNNLTDGNVTVYADTTAPTAGSVSIDKGAASTNDLTAYLTLSATDAQTGIRAMQISTDGTFDTEGVLPYSTSNSIYLHGPSGTKTVYVRYENNAGMWSTPVQDSIQLTLPPAVSSVSPNTGLAGGGQTITLTGTDFTGANLVEFGGTQAHSFTVVSPTKITVTTPAHALGLVQVQVRSPSGTSSPVAGDAFTYTAAPTVTGVSPSSGPTAGGTTTTIVGTGFTNVTAVKFGATTAARFRVESDTRILVGSPAHAAGTVSVTVTTPSGTSAISLRDAYTFTA